METLGHKADQPGLRGHSHDPENDLMKRYVVATSPKLGYGWLWVASFDTFDEASDYVIFKVGFATLAKIMDQFNNNDTLWSS